MTGTREFFDRRAARYDQEKASAIAQVLPVVRSLLHRAPAASSWAEVGIGTGLLTSHLADLLPPSGVAFDLSSGMLGVARRRRGIPVAGLVQADALVLPVRTGSFDLLVCLATLQYLSPAAIPELGRVLRAGGRLLLGECCAHPDDGSHFLRRLLEATSPARLEIAGPEDVATWLAAAGLTVLARRSTTYRRSFAGLEHKARMAGTLSALVQVLSATEDEDRRRYQITSSSIRLPYTVFMAEAVARQAAG